MNSLVKRHGNPVCSFFSALVSPMRHVSLAWKCAMVTCVVLPEQKDASEIKKMIKVKVLWTLKA